MEQVYLRDRKQRLATPSVQKRGQIVGVENEDIEIGDLVFEIGDGVVRDVHYVD